jgi:hypothetical protein
MFEITGDDIAGLGDDDLRTLVARLCEAELRRRNLPASSVTWGGNQNAKDGGLDVRIALPADTAIDGFIPRPATGYQVKKPDMPRNAILDEMRPKPDGFLRPVIAALAKSSGAYVIVSAAGSTSDVALANRKAAMAEAVSDCPDAAKLTLDFYDRTRLATWVRDHAGFIPWVRAKIGKPIKGWRGYGSWSYRPDGADATYLVDAAARIKTGDKDEGDGVSATDGINKIRDVLRTPGHVVRLVGLSGVGKTRLVEALFEPAVGTNALDPSLAVYTDVASDPDPQPELLASDLISTQAHAILVIDNCPPAIHRQLSDVIRSSGTTVSVITAEYDIREDQPEGTGVFSLDTSSIDLIEKLIKARAPHISQIDRRTIAESSGGNARVALALADTVGKNETVAGLNDAELFKRLFQQRNDPDASLLTIAQACSLVYSFECDQLKGDEAELPILGSLVGKSAEDVYAAVADLKARHLVQSRGPWRAVLPHAIANRLAASALQRIPRQKLLSTFEKAPPRLLQSFSRRLGYIDSCPEARAIVEGWLAPGGLLADVANLVETSRAMFENVAPVVPGAVLSALENALAEADEATLKKCTHFVPLLRSLAYEAEYFTRAVKLLVRFSRISEGEDAANILKSLFYVALSGTHAPLELRLKVVDELLRSADPEEQKLGVAALEAALKTDHFLSTYSFEFGMRSRDYGYYPPTGTAAADWFSTALDFAEPFALREGPVREGARRAIGNEFRGLWTNVHRTDHMERLAKAIAAKGFWRDGWIGARMTRIYNGKGMPADQLARLTSLEELLRPKDLADKVRGVVLGEKGGISLDLDDLDEVDNDHLGAMRRATATVEALGRDVAADDEAFSTLLAGLITGDYKVIAFGVGLALGTHDPEGVWRRIVAQMPATKETRIGLLGGFVQGLQKINPKLADDLLDEAVNDPVLAEWFPVLQAFPVIDAKAVGRLHQALELATAPIRNFSSLSGGRASDTIPGPDFKQLLLAISAKPEGNLVALDILSMRIHGDNMDKKASVPEIAETGRLVLDAYDFHREARGQRVQHDDYELNTVVRASLQGNDGKPIVHRLCQRLLAAAKSHQVSAFEYNDLMTGLLETHPDDVLDELVAGDKKAQGRSVSLIGDFSRHHKSPMDVVPDATLLAWCSRDPQTRYPFAAAIASLFRQENDETPKGWKDISRALLSKAPDKIAVFNEIITRLHPTGGVGSISSQYESRLKLLSQFDVDDMPELAERLTKAKAGLQAEIDAWRKGETDRDRTRSGRFE